jgi:hypothetical protein
MINEKKYLEYLLLCGKDAVAANEELLPADVAGGSGGGGGAITQLEWNK